MLIYSWHYLNGMSDAELARVSEANLQSAIVAYLQEEHPTVLFKCDTSAVKMSIGQARKMKQLGNTAKWPDLFIARRAHGFAGNFIEIKKDGTRITRANGKYESHHIERQADLMLRLGENNFRAGFAVGWRKLLEEVQWYLS